MRIATAIVLGLLATPALAADKAGPKLTPAPAAAPAVEKARFTGCYAEGSAAGVFLETTRVANGAVGAGCDWQVQSAVAGINGRVSAGDLKGWSIQARAGAALNPYLLGYGLIAYTVSDYKLNDDGALSAGLGLEALVLGHGVFVEASKNVSALRGGYSDDITTRAGVRFRF